MKVNDLLEYNLLYCLCIMTTLVTALACEDTRKSFDQPNRIEMEGPSGYISHPAPWLIQIYHPTINNEQSLQIEVSQADILLSTSEVIASGRPHTYWSIIKNIPPHQEIRYALRNTTNDQVLLNDFFTYRPVEIMEEPIPVPTSCEITWNDPQGMTINQSEDESDAAGIQSTLRFTTNLLSDGVGLLTVHDHTFVSRIHQGTATFVRVNLKPGRQHLTIQILGLRQQRCSLDTSITINDL